MARGEGPLSREERPLARGEEPLAIGEGPLSRGEGPLSREEGPLARAEGPLAGVRDRSPLQGPGVWGFSLTVGFNVHNLPGAAKDGGFC